MRVFYVVYIRDENIASHLDAIRFVCNPDEKTHAHVTVRGPYRQRFNMPVLAREVASEPVHVNGVGNFFEHRQNTVFLRCESDALKRAWFKRDYPYNPHVTLYDGRSAQFARGLCERLEKMEFSFSFEPTPLTALISRSGQRDAEMWMHLDYDLVSRVAGRPVAADTIRHMSEDERLRLAEGLAESLSAVVSRPKDVWGRGGSGRAPGLIAETVKTKKHQHQDEASASL